MSDVFSRKQRSEIMGRIKSQGNRATEIRLIELFRINKITGWRRNSELIGKPDFVFSRAKIAVFVDGCFWHGCPKHASTPKSNTAFWKAKLHRNVVRDKRVNALLRAKGWRVIRIWQHDLREPKPVVKKIKTALLSELLRD